VRPNAYVAAYPRQAYSIYGSAAVHVYVELRIYGNNILQLYNTIITISSDDAEYVVTPVTD
jgi:hypothetical protein